MLKRNAEAIEESRQRALEKLKRKMIIPPTSMAQSTIPAESVNPTSSTNSISKVISVSQTNLIPPTNSSYKVNTIPQTNSKQQPIKNTSTQKIEARFELVAKDHVSVIPANLVSREYFASLFAQSYSLSTEGHLQIPLFRLIQHFDELKKKARFPVSLEKTYLEVAKYSGISPQTHYIDKELDEICKKNNILPFQMEGIRFGISRSGRYLLADDMGLGKTLQALMVAYFYRNQWPLLVICPASLIGTWQEAVEKYFDQVILPHEIKAFFDSKDFSLDAKVSITSYDLVVRNAQCILQKAPRIIIADECHFLKNKTTKRTKTIIPILHSALHLIMLSGTPALSRPIELYTQLNAINSKLFSNNSEFGFRYCAGVRDRFGVNFKGSSNEKELGIILESTIMLRRTKQQVLQWLPAKIRKQIFLHVTSAPSTQVTTDVAALLDESLADNNSISFKRWKSSTDQKMPAILRYLGELLLEESEDELRPKLLLFAHFKDTLDQLEEWLIKHKLPHIRIDGDTGTRERQSLCDQFQCTTKIRVALLSITAASVGLTLTSAKMVIFAELFWNPGVLIQAEDRVHRIGQHDSVIIQYLLGKGTFDDYLWPLLLKKLNTLEQVGLAQNVFSGSSMQSTDRSVLDSRQTRLKFTDSTI